MKFWSRHLEAYILILCRISFGLESQWCTLLVTRQGAKTSRASIQISRPSFQNAATCPFYPWSVGENSPTYEEEGGTSVT